VFRISEPVLGGRRSRIWWVLLLRALGALLFGALMLARPKLAAFGLVWLFGVYALVDGLAETLQAARGGPRSRGWLALAGLAGVVAGLFALAEPRMMALLLMSVMGLWLIVHGLANVLGAIAARDEPGADWSQSVDGVMTALFGAGIVAAPRIGALALIWAVGSWAILHGLLILPFALKLRRAAAGLNPSRAPSVTSS
jgi:uncharacterized membrane protein HdeD (DUF308 family)